LGLGLSFATLVIAEMLGVKAGLGWYLQWARGWAEYDKVYGTLLIMALLFSGLLTLIFRCRDRFLAWQQGIMNMKWQKILPKAKENRDRRFQNAPGCSTLECNGFSSRETTSCVFWIESS